MNLFRTFLGKCTLGAKIGILLGMYFFMNHPATAQEIIPRPLSEAIGPTFHQGSFLYADIDTVHQQLYVLIESGLWSFDLEDYSWQFVDSLDSAPNNIENYQFGFNTPKGNLQIWSNGVGEMYNISPTDYTVNRIDRSSKHRNQFGHFPFFHKRGELFTFGGYGFWSWKNLLTFYNGRIDEWNIQTLASSSDVPPGRVPFTGAYDQQANSLYIFGGSRSQSGRQDDSFTRKEELHDVWKYNFNNKTWSKIGEYPSEDKKFFTPARLYEVSKTNKITSSAYSAHTNLWYLPFWDEQQSRDIIHIKPLNLKKELAYQCMQINFGPTKQFLPVNFLFNGKSNQLIFVGLDYLSNTTEYPIKLYSVHEDSIQRKMIANNDSALSAWGISFSILLLILGAGGIYLFWKYSNSHRDQKGQEPGHLNSDLPYSWLNQKEKTLIQHLQDQETFCDTSEIEELLWPDVKNYDYRRRLRNDILKSINRKVSEHWPTEQSLIIKKADPNDRRKNLYGINPEMT